MTQSRKESKLGKKRERLAKKTVEELVEEGEETGSRIEGLVTHLKERGRLILQKTIK